MKNLVQKVELSGVGVMDESSVTVVSTSAASAERVAGVNEDDVGRVKGSWVLIVS